MDTTHSTKFRAVAIAVAFGALGIGLQAQEQGAGAKKEEPGAAAHRSPRWTERLFRQSVQGKEFESFMGGELRFKDPEGKALSVVAHPGKVVKLTTDSITLQLNDGSGAKDFPVNSGKDSPDAKELSRQLRRVRVGDRALVILINGETKWAVPVVNESEKTKEEEKKKEEKDKADKEEKEKKAKEADKGKLQINDEGKLQIKRR